MQSNVIKKIYQLTGAPLDGATDLKVEEVHNWQVKWQVN
jgi:hypothetical protein